MAKIVHSVMHKGVQETSKFVPIITVSSRETASIKFERQGVTFDGFTKEQLQETVAILRADPKIREFISCIQRTYRNYEEDIASALEGAANGL